MKRMNLIVDELLLKEVRKSLDAKTMSEAVNTALLEVLRISKIRKLADTFGRISWEGDLSEMREDNGSAIKRKKR